MTMYQPQEHRHDPAHTERVEGDRDVAQTEQAERLEEQHEEPDRKERVENETDGAAGEERDHPGDVVEDEEEDRAAAHEPDHPMHVVEDEEEDRAAAHEPDHPMHVDDDRDGEDAREAERLTATSTALRAGEGAQPASTPEPVTVPEDRDAGPSDTLARTPTPAQGDFQVFGPGELEGYQLRWESIQLGFVDDPEGAATQADTVVGELLGRLTERRQALRDELGRQPQQDVDTESMRLAVRNYRSLFQRLLGS